MAVPVLMLSLVPLSQWSQATKLPPVAAGVPFWAQDYQVAALVAAGQAITAPPGVPAPPPEPGYTVNMTPGLGAATSNASPPSPWPLPLSVVQAAPTAQAPSLTTAAVTLPRPTGKGNTLVACITANGNTTNPAVSGLTLGGAADSWRPAIANTGNVVFGGAIWYDPGCAAGQNAVQVNCTGGAGTAPEIYVAVFEVPGILLFDKGAFNDATSGATSWTSGAAPAATLASEIFFGVATATAAVPVVTGAGSWVTQSTGAGTFDQVSGYQVVSVKSAAQFSGTIPSGGYSALVAGFWRSA